MEHSGRHFIAVLGTNFYTDCVYQVKEEGFSYKTPYAQLAALKYVMPDHARGDRITILLTDRAEQENWLDRDYREREIRILAGRGIQILPGEKKTGFQKILEAEYPQVSVETVRIREGRSREELDEIFEKMYGAVHPGETIYFDITHGLRNIPMQVLTVLHYAKALKEIRVGGIYYGAYEIGEDREDGLRYVDLLDMSMCSKILDWTNAAESFVKGGSSSQIWELKESGQDVSELERAALKSLHDLTSCLNTCKGKSNESPDKSIQKAYEDFRMHYDRLCESHTSISEAPLLRLFERIESDLDVFRQKLFFWKDGRRIDLNCTATGMAAVDWAVRKNLTQLGFTALKETIVTCMCERYQVPAEDRTVRNTTVWDILRDMAGQYEALEKRGDMHMDRQWFCDHKLMTTPYRTELSCMIMEIPEELLRVTVRIMRFRDALNDFGFSENEKEGDVLTWRELQEQLRNFQKTLQKIMEEQGVIFEGV
ncbi:MAG: hypothetical protein K2N46_04855 [Lachnospiraceae bacterium]|nr:hypothetical protein [Lachnospiraceae bacterium]